jgi:CheY-like chemotaxis protein
LTETLAELRSTEQHLIEQERHRALTQMASGIAHDFNNALSTVLGFAELLLESPDKRKDDERARRYLELIHRAATHASETVRRMRKFYRPREQGLFQSLDLNSLVEEAVSMTRPKWEEQKQAEGVTITVEQKLGDVERVEGNEAELHEMLTNLIFNAVDAMPEGGRLLVSTEQSDEKVVLTVSDTGVGMSLEERKRCMEPFYSTKDETGTGLDLSAVRGILKRHSGCISVQSEKGEGTTFRIKLPAAGSTPVSDENPPQKMPSDMSLRMLVVENDERQCEMLREYARMMNQQVKTVSDGHKALEEFRRDSYDVVITDRAMPGMGGDEVAARIKKDAPQTPVIMLTGFGDMMDAANERVEDVDRLISKPITLEDLQETILQVMRGNAESSALDESKGGNG